MFRKFLITSVLYSPHFERLSPAFLIFANFVDLLNISFIFKDS